MIKPSEFKDWQTYYWTYQNILAKKYLIPMLEKQGIVIDQKKVFEIGCGNGGVIEAFAEKCSKAVGVDIKTFDHSPLNTPKVKYVTADIFDPSQQEKYVDLYDIILLRDVIEHLPDKKSIFEICDQLMKPDGALFVTFPPFYSPFGAHQQVYTKTKLGKLPYLQMLQHTLYLKYLKAVEKGNEPAHQLAEEMFASKTTIASLNQAINKSNFEIQYQDYYLTRPSYEIRYGIKPRKAQFLQHVPVLRDLFVMGVYMILRKRTKQG